MYVSISQLLLRLRYYSTLGCMHLQIETQGFLTDSMGQLRADRHLCQMAVLDLVVILAGLVRSGSSGATRMTQSTMIT